MVFLAWCKLSVISGTMKSHAVTGKILSPKTVIQSNLSMTIVKADLVPSIPCSSVVSQNFIHVHAFSFTMVRGYILHGVMDGLQK